MLPGSTLATSAVGQETTILLVALLEVRATELLLGDAQTFSSTNEIADQLCNLGSDFIHRRRFVEL